MPTDDAFDRWFIFISADSVATRAIPTAEVLDAHRRGVLSERTVIHHHHLSRRQAITVKDLVDRAKKK